MTVPTSRQNQADHYNQRLADAVARGPMHVVAFWYDATRKLCREAERQGNPDLANKLASHLHDFFQAHTQ